MPFSKISLSAWMPVDDQDGEVKGRPPDIKQRLCHRGEDKVHLNGPPTNFSASGQAFNVVEITGLALNTLILPDCKKGKFTSGIECVRSASIGRHGTCELLSSHLY